MSKTKTSVKMTDEELRRKYEKRARKIAGMAAYGKHCLADMKDDKYKAQHVIDVVFEYLAYIDNTRNDFTRPLSLDGYIEKRKSRKYKAPDDDKIIEMAKDFAQRCTAAIDNIVARCRDDEDGNIKNPDCEHCDVHKECEKSNYGG